MRDTFETFRRHYFKWVAEHNKPSKNNPAGFTVKPDELFLLLQSRTPIEYLRRIGAALEDGWLETESAPDRTYFIREGGSERSGQPTVYHQGNGEVIPWWELYVQLADYSQLRAVAERQGLVVRMEESQMDINVWAGQTLVLYVENKTTREKAAALLKKIREYGEAGFEMDALDKGNDPLRKSKYLFRNDYRPRFFGLSAVGYQQLFSIDYLGGNNRFRLVEEPGDLTTPLLTAEIVGSPPARSVADSLAIEFQRLLAASSGAAEVQPWMSPGTKGTSFNLYIFRPESQKHAIAAGVYKNGEIWTDVSGIGDSLTERLAGQLETVGISLDTSKNDAFWRRGSGKFAAGQEDVIQVSEVVISALLSVSSPAQE